MNTALVKAFGQIAGIGGLSLAVLFLLFRDVIGRVLRRSVTRDQTYRIIRLSVILTFLVAVLGMVAWAYVAVVELRTGRLEQRLQEVEEARSRLEEELTRVRATVIRLAADLGEAAGRAEEIARSIRSPSIKQLAFKLQELVDQFKADFGVEALSESQALVIRDAESALEGSKSYYGKYDFEHGALLGWKRRTIEDSQGCTHVERSTEYARGGKYSLKMVMDLIGRDDEKHKGEAFVNWVEDSHPGGKEEPIDLSNKTITAWVWVPPGSYGDAADALGFQVFVKNEDYQQYLYGSWTRVPEGKWTEVSLKVGTSAPEDGEKSEEFDPRQVVELGVKMALSDESTDRFQGGVYVDDVDWSAR